MICAHLSTVSVECSMYTSRIRAARYEIRHWW